MTRATLLLAIIPCTALAQSGSREQALGKQLAVDVESRSTRVDDPAVVQYVSRIAQKLAQAAELQAPLTVRVITGDTAYAFPGASCYVNAGLILKAASEAELAGAIAHLLAHMALWSSTPLEIGSEPQIPIYFAAACARLGGTLQPGWSPSTDRGHSSRRPIRPGWNTWRRLATILRVWPISSKEPSLRCRRKRSIPGRSFPRLPERRPTRYATGAAASSSLRLNFTMCSSASHL